MSEVILIAWGRTDWTEQHRLIGGTNLPLNDAGKADLALLAETLDAAPPDAIKSGPEDVARDSARIIAKRFKLRVGRPTKELAELNLGLWSGLTESEIEQRFTRAHEQWRENAETVCPPEGESVGDAAVRLNRAAQRVLRKHDEGRVALVVGPMAAAVLRCRLSGESLEGFWRYYDEGVAVHRVPRPPTSAAEAKPDAPAPPG